MAEELSMFETTHMLGSSIASSPLLAEAWRQSAAADAAGGAAGVVAREADDGVVYVAFSGLPTLQALTPAGGTGFGFFSAVPLAGAGGASGGELLFSPLHQAGNGEGAGEPALVHAASLHCFLAAYNTPLFQDTAAREAEECLRAASTIERIPTVNCAKLARKLAAVTPFRAQIEWYKSSCDERTGYYDAFKQRAAAPSRKEHQVNLNRRKLAMFWDGVLDMLDRNQLPHDFPNRRKWVNASQFYKLLVEPLDIAEYYRKGKHRTAGHYVAHGRERRYRVFDRWWGDKERQIGRRSRYAGLTQDSCFWARVEEARDAAERARGERDPCALRRLLDGMEAFDRYARSLIERKEVSVDVLAEGSSYKLWEEEWKRLRSELNYL